MFPYSPRWLAMVSREDEALSSLAKLRRLPETDRRVQLELRGIIEEARFQQVPTLVHELTLAEVMTAFALKKCSDELRFQLRALEERCQGHMRSGASSIADQRTPTSMDELSRLKCESDSTKERLAILNNAAEQASSGAIHVVEDVEIGIDGEQTLITSHEQLFEVRRVTLGNRARQFIMSGSDTAIQDLLKSDKKNFRIA